MRISDWSSDVALPILSGESFARSGKRRQASASAAACTGLRPWAIHASVSAGSNGSDIIGLLRCESQETWRRWSEGTAYRSDSFSITPTTGIRARKPAPEIGMHRDQRLQIGRAHVLTPVTNAHLVCRHLLEKKKQTKTQ